ncbi:MAG: hypothetical protein H0X24_09330 [Ktedonobacterales bacterium]|nr:hypothetical protein [Ktedonobacterales bacterium]
MPMNPPLVTFTNFGRVNATTREAARQTHNATAGDPQGVAGAQALGDFSHLVFVPAAGWNGELMFIDQWVSAEGLQQFFADPQVQAGATTLFSAYEPVVWQSAEEFNAYHLNAPLGAKERYVSVLRGTATSIEEARTAMNAIWQPRMLAAHRNGLQSHEMFVRLAAPGSAEAREVMGIDVWTDLEGMSTVYGEPTFMPAFEAVLTGITTWVLQRPEGDWIEW